MIIGVNETSMRKPALIYGNMLSAENLYKYCIDKKLEVEGFVVDEKYWSDNQYLCGCKVESIRKYIDRIENYNLFIGFDNVTRTIGLLKNKDLLRCNVYLIHQAENSWKWTNEYIKINEALFQMLRETLADKKSKETLDALMGVKTGNGKLEDLLRLAEDNQYFNYLTYELSPNEEIFVDCGAFNGDTVGKYNKFVDGRYKKILALEPIKENLEFLKNAASNYHDVEIFPLGAWKEEDTLYFKQDGSGSKAVDNKTELAINANSLDNLFQNENITFIKMDIEGSEYPALLGAQGVIEKNMPKLAICVYHKASDLLDIFNYLKQLKINHKSYKFFLRHHGNAESETVLYAIPAAVE